ncbi:HNH/ENDO VII family nuclease [Bacillus wiedmannii]|uniref:HNH/ENDO VII family nuclease n=2 Tax=Bacillus wiedmannii TaxID=1890302 RepID=UPI001CC1C830|nr:HNH/ENDO VII family nuclease [Bacillus wiedmannii]
MDVQYRPKDWVEMKDGLDQITKDTFVKLFDANRLLADTQGKIQDLDEDRSINFHYKDQTEIIAKLREAYTTLGKFCDEAGQAVYDAIDKPFFVQMDQFAQKMRDVSIKNFETTNRIGFTTITTVQGSSGYGETAQTIKTTKNTITVDDIFKESYAFDEVLRADYEERKRQDPTLKLDYEEYRKHIPSTRGFEYLSIEDDQKKLETWRDFGIGVITIGGLFICPPLGIAAGTVFGILEVKSAYDGEDWETHRKLDKEERVVRGVFGGLDAMSGAGSLMKSAKGIGTLVKLPGDGTNFNPNVGKNMVQSLRDNNTLKNTLIPVGVSWMDTAGIGIKMPVVRFSKVGEIGEDFTKARVIAKDDPYQHIKGSGGSGVSSEGSVVKGTEEVINHKGFKVMSNIPTVFESEVFNLVKIEGKVKIKKVEEPLDISRRMYQRNDIEWNLKDTKGLTNRQRAKLGLAPIGKDGYPIELHHLLQEEPGSMVEALRTVHRGPKNKKILHGLLENGDSFRNNPVLNAQYKKFQSEYWKWRIIEIEKQGL